MVLTFLSKYREGGLLFLRLGLGAMMMIQGAPKMFGGPHAWAQTGAVMKNFGIYLAPTAWGFLLAFSEFFGGLLLLIGLLFRPACLLLCFAIFISLCLQFKRGDTFWHMLSRPAASHAVALGFVFCSLLFIGPGKYSVDKN